MNSFVHPGPGPDGFHAFCHPASVREYEKSIGSEGLDETLANLYINEVKREQPAIETRIQMHYPEVYAEIDRLEVESELRLSVFWPLFLLTLLLAFYWSPIALCVAVVPPFLLKDGFDRKWQASDKVWSVLMAGEVKSPVLDTIESSRDQAPKKLHELMGGGAN
jgi:hypothetical protein